MIRKPEEVAKERASERSGQNIEGRQVLALEQIADTLEATRDLIKLIAERIGRK